MNKDDANKRLFREAMTGVKPLKSSNKVSTRHKSKATPLKMPVSPKDDPILLEIKSNLESHEIINFSRPGLQHKLLRRFRQGKLPLDAEIDLHNLTLIEAHDALDNFIRDAQHQHWRCLLVIHGKGYHSSQGFATLKNYVYEYAKEHGNILAIHSAVPRDGGTGACYLLLKNYHGE